MFRNIMGASDFGGGEHVFKYWARAISGEESVFCRPWFMNYSAHVISDEEKARLDEVTNLPSMYNRPIDACPT